MLWLEMSRDEAHGGGSWDFTHCLWAPTYKQSRNGSSGGKWTFLEMLLEVRAGDPILHLRGEGGRAAFVGFSTAATDGFETAERPDSPGQWGYASSFYRVPLKDFVKFPQSILLKNVFSREEAALRVYFNANRAQTAGQKKHIFYVIQSGRLQCLNGAYLSEVDNALENFLLGQVSSQGVAGNGQPASPAQVATGVRVQELMVRVGQRDFSKNVRSNYGGHCCFPECQISDGMFLVGAHIARWSDVPDLRGEVANGLCLCLLHDKAFEAGLFTITADLRIAVNTTSPIATRSVWCSAQLLPYDGRSIRQGRIAPSVNALRYHWDRIGFTPS